MNYVSWFCVLFFIGSFLRLHPTYKDTNTRFWGFLLLLTVLFAITSVICLIWAHKNGLLLFYDTYAFVSDSNAPLAVLVSVCAFMYFKNVKIKQSNWINIIGGGTFGVLLIHANSGTMRHWLWQDVCDNVGYYSSDFIYIHAILVPVAVFTICSVIEYIRMRTIETPFINVVHSFILKRLYVLSKRGN